MSHRRNQLRNDPPFAEEFKPARILGGARIEEIENNVSIGLQHERFNEFRDRLVYFDDPTKKDEDIRSVFTLTTKDTGSKPIVHPVEVMDINEKYDEAYVIETETGARGIVVVLIKNTMNKDNEVYANIYHLPFSTLSQILSNCSSNPIGVKVKQDERIKLQVTIRPSDTGEPTYKTHDTEVILSQVGEEEINKLKTTLQFISARIVAHFIGQVIDIKPKEAITPQTRLHHQLFSVSLGTNANNLGTRFIIASLIIGAITQIGTNLSEIFERHLGLDNNNRYVRIRGDVTNVLNLLTIGLGLYGIVEAFQSLGNEGNTTHNLDS